MSISLRLPSSVARNALKTLTKKTWTIGQRNLSKHLIAQLRTRLPAGGATAITRPRPHIYALPRSRLAFPDSTNMQEPVNQRTARPAERITDNMERPALDDRSYRVIMLPNQLEALLIHDPETDKASGALDVNVGSFSDSTDMPGLAHAVEHMLFMGTRKVDSSFAWLAPLQEIWITNIYVGSIQKRMTTTSI
jgi:hypothetical protein